MLEQTAVFQSDKLVNPTWLVRDGDVLVAAIESSSPDGGLATLRLDTTTGKLTDVISRVGSSGVGSACIALRKDVVLVANYMTSPSLVASYRLRDGQLSEQAISTITEFEGGSNVIESRQEAAHGHYVGVHPRQDDLVIVADLGADLVKTFKLDKDGVLGSAQDFKAAPGTGPRQAAFHPTADVIYVLYELSSEMAVYDVELSSGRLSHVQTISMVAPDTKQSRDQLLAAAVRISQDGRFLYGSVRGDDLHPDGDCVVVYSISADGRKLTPIQHARAPGGGWHIRDIELSPDDRYVATGTMAHGGDVYMFERDSKTGLLSYKTQLRLKDDNGAVISPAKFLFL